ncbi:cell division protein DamX [Shimwellia pseudoproteus]|uniref:cell division protein DamX n=1 Tax=Shimwellia pseudoproteus TaxID=570012 RepID=UPI0018EC07CC|nr:cell division protein DamX [Shimwellia pseudoproteus]MBJ3815016.1 cell division protein DamX [Shimwellia pseudoproteus]
MDERKPEDELKTDPSDRRPVRSRKSAEYDNDPHINVDDIDVDDEDDRRPSRARGNREEREEPEVSFDDDTMLDDDAQDDDDAEPAVERRPRKRKKTPAPAPRQRLMMGVGILVLLVLIVGIGAALKTPSSDADTASQSGEKNINLASPAGDATAAAGQPAPVAADQTAQNNPQPEQAQQEVTLPPVSSQPTQAQSQPAPAGQQRVEVQGDLNNALTQPAGQQINQVASTSTLPTQPATVAAVNGQRHQPVVRSPAEPTVTASRERREPEPRKVQPVQSKPQAPAKTVVSEPKPVMKAAPAKTAPVKETAPVQTAKAATTEPKTTPAPAATSTTTAAAAGAAAAAASSAATTATTAAVSSGNVDALKTAPASHYTLQLSSSSNYNNLNAWAKKEKLQNFVVYQTKRNGQPWYVLVSGVYASKDDAKHAVSSLPADVQAKNPWAKPIHQVQSDLKQ